MGRPEHPASQSRHPKCWRGDSARMRAAQGPASGGVLLLLLLHAPILHGSRDDAHRGLMRMHIVLVIYSFIFYMAGVPTRFNTLQCVIGVARRPARDAACGASGVLCAWF